MKNILIAVLCIVSVLLAMIVWGLYFKETVKTWSFSTSGSASLYMEKCP